MAQTQLFCFSTPLSPPGNQYWFQPIRPSLLIAEDMPPGPKALTAPLLWLIVGSGNMLTSSSMERRALPRFPAFSAVNHLNPAGMAAMASVGFIATAEARAPANVIMGLRALIPAPPTAPPTRSRRVISMPRLSFFSLSAAMPTTSPQQWEPHQ